MSVSMIHRGSTPIPLGVCVLTVTGLALSFIPTGITAKVRKLDLAGDNLLAFPYGTPTVDGFSVELSATTTSAFYVLDWEAWSTETSIESSTSLALSYSDLVDEVKRFLGYPATLTNDQTAEVDRYVQSGVRQFYYPPAMQGVEAGYQWSFLKPSTSLSITAGMSIVPLPADFGRITGDMYFADTVHLSSVVIVSEARIQALLHQNSDRGIPRYVAIRFKETYGEYGQAQEAIFWPPSDDAYFLTYSYEAYNGKISAANPCPLGGMRHAELITESCLAIAEQRANDEKGLHTERFQALLVSGIAMDRKGGSRYYGHMGGSGEDVIASKAGRLNGSVSYKSDTW